jgi:hypothetical protein
MARAGPCPTDASRIARGQPGPLPGLHCTRHRYTQGCLRLRRALIYRARVRAVHQSLENPVKVSDQGRHGWHRVSAVTPRAPSRTQLQRGLRSRPWHASSLPLPPSPSLSPFLPPHPRRGSDGRVAAIRRAAETAACWLGCCSHARVDKRCLLLTRTCRQALPRAPPPHPTPPLASCSGPSPGAARGPRPTAAAATGTAGRPAGRAEGCEAAGVRVGWAHGRCHWSRRAARAWKTEPSSAVSASAMCRSFPSSCRPRGRRAVSLRRARHTRPSVPPASCRRVRVERGRGGGGRARLAVLEGSGRLSTALESRGGRR